MKLLFVHGGEKVKSDHEGNLYTGGSYNLEVWNRYLRVFRKVTFIARKDANVYDSDYAKKQFNFLDKKQINFVEVPNLLSSLKTFINYKKRIAKKRIIRDSVRNNDYIIARIPSDEGYAAIRYAKKFKKPYIVEVVGCAWDAYWNYNLKGKVLAPFKYLNMKMLVWNSPYAIYVTNEFLQNRYPTKGNIENCSNVSLTDLSESILINKLSKIKKIKNDHVITIGTAAAVDVKYKGQQYIIEALGKLKEQGYSNFKYQLVGGGDQNYLRKVAVQYNVVNQVEFLGSIPHDKVFEWLDTIDIYIQPSKQEGLPRALIEAMSRGVLSIGAKTAGIPELIEDKYVFSNSKNNIKEIISILTGISKRDYILQANRNFEEAKKYQKDIIEERRNKFFNKFAKENKVIIWKVDSND